MFVNLVNTDIPFEEYQLTQDKIDALKFRLLQSESYLNINDLDEEKYGEELYRVFLLNVDDQLRFFVVSMGREDIDAFFPLLRMIDVSDGTLKKRFSDEEILAFIINSYELYPNQSFMSEAYYMDNLQRIIRHLRNMVESFVEISSQDYRIEHSEDPALHHYEAYYRDSRRKGGSSEEQSPEEKMKIECLMNLVLEKIYGIKYKPSMELDYNRIEAQRHVINTLGQEDENILLAELKASLDLEED